MDNRGVSPIIATILLVSMVVALVGIVTIWVNSQSQSAMSSEGERRERMADRKSEILELVHVDADNDVITLANTGTSDSAVTYVKINNTDFSDLNPVVEIGFGESIDITTVVLPADVNVVEIGTLLGNVFVFTAPSAVIQVESVYCTSANSLYVFDGTKSVDADGSIVLWNWHFADVSGDFTWTGQRVTVDFPRKTDPWTVTLTVIDNTGMSSSMVITDFEVCA